MNKPVAYMYVREHGAAFLSFNEIDLPGLKKIPLYEDVEAWDEKRIDTIGSNGNEGLHYEN